MGVTYVVIKGGHGDEKEAIDLLFDGSDFSSLVAERIPTKIRMEQAVLFRQRLQQPLPMAFLLMMLFN